jgi:acyl carrier protein
VAEIAIARLHGANMVCSIDRTSNDSKLEGRSQTLTRYPTPSSSDINERPQLGPRNSVERQLMNIWKEILKIDSMGIDDNFFMLGGHSLLAARLMSRIEKVTGKRIPLATLLQHPTVEGLANAIRNNDFESQWQCIVPIREGGNLLPLFCMHAAGGNVLLYRELANRMHKNRPVYGVQSSALQHGLPTAKTVEEMATEYVAEIRKLQPRGPYHLAGYCLGRVPLRMKWRAN